ncbi:MAG: zinc-ribbon domain-containing protein [Desulfobacterales bacterium]|nr:MAG: zinc-ribbon domain-containing protein [Desulfobacterales bacterium]
MEVQCGSCKAKFKIPDDKLPAGQVISLKCPKCESKMEVDTRSGAQVGTPGAGLQAIMEDMASDTYDAALKPFDFLEEGVETALICEQDDAVREKIRSVLQGMDYNITDVESIRDALKFMRFHNFDLVIMNEGFDGSDPESNYVLRYLSQLPTSTRRDIFVVLLGNGFGTGDSMTAFNKSVNLALNLENIDEFERFLKLSMAEHEELYRVLKESVKRMGRA